MGFLNYRRAFDTVMIWTLEQALKSGKIDYGYSNLVKRLYNATLVPKNPLKNFNQDQRKINVNSQRLHHLRFAGDILTFAKSKHEITSLLSDIETTKSRPGTDSESQVKTEQNITSISNITERVIAIRLTETENINITQRNNSISGNATQRNSSYLDQWNTQQTQPQPSHCGIIRLCKTLR